jgi:hypothetical protein
MRSPFNVSPWTMDLNIKPKKRLLNGNNNDMEL